jgi:hypothetical protein
MGTQQHTEVSSGQQGLVLLTGRDEETDDTACARNIPTWVREVHQVDLHNMIGTQQIAQGHTRLPEAATALTAACAAMLSSSCRDNTGGLCQWA